MDDHADELKKKNDLPFMMAFFGLILVILGLWILFRNEIRRMKTAKLLVEARENVLPITDTNNIPPEYNDHLVHLFGTLCVNQQLSDPLFPVIAINCVQLKKKVEIHHREDEPRSPLKPNEIEGTRITYWCTVEWKDRPLIYPLTHLNSSKLPTHTYTLRASEAKIDNVELGSAVRNKFNKFFNPCYFYFGPIDPLHPREGDVKISFLCAGRSGDNYSVIGKLDNGVIVPYMSRANREILILRQGSIGVNEMLDQEVSENDKMTQNQRFLAGYTLLTGIVLLIFIYFAY